MNETLLAEAVLGRDAEEFVKSELGRYILGRARRERQEAQEKLNKVASWRRRRIQELQNEIWRAEAFEGWLFEIIMDGRNAEKVLDESAE